MLRGGGKPLLKEPLESVKNAIENIYKNDNKKSKKLTDEFNRFLNAQFEDYESICSGIIKEINKDKKHLGGVQAGIVRWCKNVIKGIKAGKKKAEKAASNPMAFAENLGENFLNGLF